MIVISLLLILITIAVPVYNQAILRAKEPVLRQNLFTMRQVIDQYTLDKQKAPQSLGDLVSAGYLRQIRVDPLPQRASSTSGGLDFLYRQQSSALTLASLFLQLWVIPGRRIF
jgi:general secretion pathway protein G